MDIDKYKHINMSLFRESMQHISTKIDRFQKTYERLEFLGDAIFHMVITEYIYERYDTEAEGFLTRLRIRIERGDSMAELAKILDLEPFVQIYGNINDHVLEDIFEAFLGAFYLNFGIRYTRIFIFRLIENHKNLPELISHDDNYKDLLLRYFHQMKWGHPTYEEERNKNIINIYPGKYVSVVSNPYGKILGRGVAKNKKKSEQLASKMALTTLGVIIDGEIDEEWMSKMEKNEKEVKEKNKGNKKSDIYNPNNKLMKWKDIKDILITYNIVVPKDIKVKIRPFHEAMTHKSYLAKKNKKKKENKDIVGLQKKSNERLQFLGDAVIHFVIGEYIFHKYPNADEGFLTRLRCKLENRETLYALAKQTGIDKFILISQNIELLYGRNNVNIISGGFEAFIGAIYLELGLKVTKQFITEVIRNELNINKIAESETNYKDLILKIYHKYYWGRPKYRLIKEEGPDHCKMFTMGIFLKGKLMGSGKASSKKKAEQIASKKMYYLCTKNGYI
jgi:ribonuclease III